ncbi:hypothetical protein BXY66_0894 [Shimia isoporae]|uniref:DUF6455 domain-containing protein n=1 Tax=Shimia isoporae TaxID=647720 RepID=A0A4R1NQ87_9RHOB|nr:DUF6455 family protein [Shimia isoporae]TCL08853.1 hypothetical protein BXY66_0894 [Shimia isoporae]
MKPLGKAPEHLMKIRSMAKVAGADLQGAAEDGVLSQEDWARMVEKCRACDWDEGCARFLARGRLEGPVDIPEGCVNRDRLMELAATNGEEE